MTAADLATNAVASSEIANDPASLAKMTNNVVGISGGALAGNGAGLTNVNAATLGGAPASNFATQSALSSTNSSLASTQSSLSSTQASLAATQSTVNATITSVGLQMPRFSSPPVTASPGNAGLMFFNLSLGKLMYSNGSAWVAFPF